jgi:hypothetical protein
MPAQNAVVPHPDGVPSIAPRRTASARVRRVAPTSLRCESAASESAERTDLVHQNLYAGPLEEGSDAVRHVEGIRTRRVI